MLLTYILLALLVGAITILARGSARRLIVAGGAGLVVTFLMLPFAAALGAFSRHTITPTPIAFSSVMPALWLAPVLGLAVVLLIAFRRTLTPTIVGGFGLLAGLVSLGLAWLWYASPQAIVRIAPVSGVLEALIPLGALALGLLLARGLPKAWVNPGYAVAVLAAFGLGAYLFNPSAETTFDALRGYYKVVQTPSEDDLALVLKDWTADLEFNNKERARINEEWTGLLQQRTASLPERDRQELEAKIRQVAEQRAGYGIFGDEATLEPLGPITQVSAIPTGYSVGRDASETSIRRLFPQRVSYGFGAWLLFATLLTVGGAGLLLRNDALEAADLTGGLVFATIAATLAFGFNAVEFDLGRFIKGWPFIQDFANRATPPDWNGILSDVLKSMTITVATAMIGTAIAATLALPTSLLAARNLTQKSLVGRIAYVLTRVFFNVDRGVDTLILALVLVAAVGLGPLAGVLAMGIHSMADLGKLYSEAIENADKGPIEALEASGAPGTSVVRWAVLPQVLPLFVSYTLYRFEINFRVSIILGFVGAGGVGFLIQETMRSGKYDQMVVAVLAVVVMVNVLDFISASVRRRIIG